MLIRAGNVALSYLRHKCDRNVLEFGFDASAADMAVEESTHLLSGHPGGLSLFRLGKLLLIGALMFAGKLRSA
jgi:hypothetical protein